MPAGSPNTRVTALHLHPVKACRRLEVDRAVVGPYGLAGDREWQVQGPDGQMMNQRSFPGLARVAPLLLPDDGLLLRHVGMRDLPVARPREVDGDARTLFGRVRLADAGEQAAAWFEQVLAVPCRLAAIAPGYRRRVVVGGDLFDQEVSLADAAPVHLVNAASLRFLQERAVERFGIERFRPNLVVDGCDPWEEDTWLRVGIGAAEVTAVLPWPRCAVPQVDQDTGQRHREPAVVLRRHRWCAEAPSLPEALRPIVTGKALFGVGGSVRPEGAALTVGDPVDVLSTRDPLVAAPG